MPWPQQYLDIRDEMLVYPHEPWWTGPELAKVMRWSRSKTDRWLQRMICDRWIIWRWHPKRHGWHATRQYALPWKARN